MNQLGFLDFDTLLAQIDKSSDPLVKLNDTIDWEIFRPTLEQARKKPKNQMQVPKASMSYFWECFL